MATSTFCRLACRGPPQLSCQLALCRPVAPNPHIQRRSAARIARTTSPKGTIPDSNTKKTRAKSTTASETAGSPKEKVKRPVGRPRKVPTVTEAAAGAASEGPSKTTKRAASTTTKVAKTAKTLKAPKKTEDPINKPAKTQPVGPSEKDLAGKDPKSQRGQSVLSGTKVKANAEGRSISTTSSSGTASPVSEAIKSPKEATSIDTEADARHRKGTTSAEQKPTLTPKQGSGSPVRSNASEHDTGSSIETGTLANMSSSPTKAVEMSTKPVEKSTTPMQPATLPRTADFRSSEAEQRLTQLIPASMKAREVQPTASSDGNHDSRKSDSQQQTESEASGRGTSSSGKRLDWVKPTARRLTAIYIACTVVLVTTPLVWDRMVLGKERPDYEGGTFTLRPLTASSSGADVRVVPRPNATEHI